jgi:hypothetical protein
LPIGAGPVGMRARMAPVDTADDSRRFYRHRVDGAAETAVPPGSPPASPKGDADAMLHQQTQI